MQLLKLDDNIIPGIIVSNNSNSDDEGDLVDKSNSNVSSQKLYAVEFDLFNMPTDYKRLYPEVKKRMMQEGVDKELLDSDCEISESDDKHIIIREYNISRKNIFSLFHTISKKTKNNPNSIIDEIVARIRNDIEIQLGPLYTAVESIKHMFDELDINGDRQLSASEIADGFNRLNIHVTDDDIDILFHRYDLDESGQISYMVIYA